jgi:phospholipase C
MTTIQTVCLAAITVAAPFAHVASGQVTAQKGSKTAYPIEHLVIIFQENISFDHYFATYPVAANPAGEPVFVAKPGTPTRERAHSRPSDQKPKLAPAPAA